MFILLDGETQTFIQLLVKIPPVLYRNSETMKRGERSKVVFLYLFSTFFRGVDFRFNVLLKNGREKSQSVSVDTC